MRSEEDIQKSIQDGISEIAMYPVLKTQQTEAISNLVEAFAKYNVCENLFDGEWIPGFYTTNGGGLIVTESTIAAKNKMNCYPGCSIHVEYGAVVGTIMCRFYDVYDRFIHVDIYKNSADTADFVAPANAVYFRISLFDSNGMTVENALELKVRTNDRFETLKNYIDTAINNLRTELTATTN